MKHLLLTALILPGSAWLLLSLPFRWSERAVSTLCRVTTALYCLVVLSMIGNWALGGFIPMEGYFGNVFSHHDYRFPLVFYFDAATAAFAAMTAFFVFIIVTYSQFYLHREQGYRRFFALLLMFLTGMDCLVTAGTIDLLFAGWEMVGLSSFLLIGFYYERDQPIRNAVRTFGVYRVCDVGLLLGACLSHHLWHENLFFSSLMQMGTEHILAHISHASMVGLSILILLAACGKSAQFPFCFWLPRAMEGPTPSSAIFYGALSVHAGVFLLERTYFLWHSIWIGPVLVGGVGLITATIATLSGRVQSNIKGQIAYASAAQVGIQFLELALGFPKIALLHFVGNACFRCYQLLISPSVVTYLVRLQSQADVKLKPSDWSLERLLPNRVRSSLYVFALHEGYMEHGFREWIFRPLLRLGRGFEKFPMKGYECVGLGVGLVFALSHYPKPWMGVVVGLCFGGAFREVLVALIRHRAPLAVLNAAGRALLFASIPIFIVEPAAFPDTAGYLFFIGVAWILGYVGLRKGWASCVLLCFVTLVGFPLTPTFLGEDLLLNQLVSNHLWIAMFFTVIAAIVGVGLARALYRPGLGFGPNMEGRIKTHA